MGYLVHAYFNISSTRYYKDDSCWSVDLKLKTTKDIISIESFMEVRVLNQYVLVRKILILNQDFIAPPSEEELVTFIQELGYSGMCNMLSVIHTDQMHQPWRTFVAIINRCISGKTTGLDRLRESLDQILWGKVPPRKARKYKKVASPSRKLSLVKESVLIKKAKRVKRPAKKSTTASTTSVVIRDTPGVSVSKKKTPAKVALHKSKKDSHMLHASGSGDGVGSQPKDDSEDDNDDDSDDDSKGDDDKADSDDDGNSDDDDNPSFTLKDYDEEYESDDDYENVYKEEDDDLYKDVDLRSLGIEHQKERKGDAEMTNVNQNVSQEKSYEQVIEDTHVTLTS
ncbi:hypothetical protein Tco_0112059 [Tanacetum coccineum]